MKDIFEMLGFYRILEQLGEQANTQEAKERIKGLRPFLDEIELRKELRETSQARELLDNLGLPPIPVMERIQELVEKAVRGELILAENMEQIGTFLIAVRRLKDYLKRGIELSNGIAFYYENLIVLEELEEQIARSIRGGRIDDYASGLLRDIRRDLQLLEEKMKRKAEDLLRTQKKYMAENFVVTRNGRICLPVKKDAKGSVAGTVVDKSSTGATLFIEPKSLSNLREELDNLKLAEDAEERRILYEIADNIAGHEAELKEDIRVIGNLDFIFAKGKLSQEMDAREPAINTEHYLFMERARHPMLNKDTCVPLDFKMDGGTRGVIITGPNTGGKTVSIKTVGLLSLMACAGLHIPCENADICMNNQVLCDIGDGQNIADNLSTFSSHITQVIEILKRVTKESLVILDELGSGTDPAEGMGIAIAILEEIRKSGCLFLVTTHYPEVKNYAAEHAEIVSARMTFDRVNLKPLYQLEIGKSGESCALYIARRLGIPGDMIRLAAERAYGEQGKELSDEIISVNESENNLQHINVPRIHKQVNQTTDYQTQGKFVTGDSVLVYPEQKVGIVVKAPDKNGDVLVMVQKEKRMINHTRLKLKVAAKDLYPEGYDFSILFDTVENRKARHQMMRKYQGDVTLNIEE